MFHRRSDADTPFAQQRQRMVETQIELRGIRNARVLAAMETVPREEFVPAELRERAYDDGPLPIGQGQTISQPLTVAFMAQALQLTGEEKVLEIGTGSGYGAAV
ncbi:MAG: protein-L-isoaspartate O-methyltransferase, partial [Pirellulaceae bacterium]|nr:protein-L-isoaspartate O-methyltransferase [Pirellulaceae bacterium]